MIGSWTTAARSHVGLVRKRNEDRFFVGEHLMAVADGLGGHVSGDVASQTVIDAIQPFDLDATPDAAGEVLGRAIDAASTAMRRRILEDPKLAGMGTTLVAVLRSGNDIAIGNVGDSRAYLLRASRLTQLTDDHVYGRLLANAGNVPHLPEKLSRFLDGRADGRSPDLAPLKLEHGDRLLLCSDGLSSFVPESAVASILETAAHPDEAADRLVAAALEQGGLDNVTVVVINA